jgi:2-dehydropantoate 2-reductase
MMNGGGQTGVQNMRIAVIGAGGVGGGFGAALAKAGADVTFVARGAHLAAMREHGLRVEGDRGETLINPVQATDDPASVGPVDIVLFCVKLWDIESAGELIKPLIRQSLEATGDATGDARADAIGDARADAIGDARGTGVIPLQNGIDAGDRLLPILGSAHVMAGTVSISATIARPGVIRQTGSFMSMAFGERDGRASPRAVAFHALCQTAGFDITLSQDIAVPIWQKFILLTAVSGGTALTRLPLGPLRDDPEVFWLLESLMRETEAVGRAEGVALPKDAVDTQTATIRSTPPTARASMAVDLSRGNRLELPWLAGKVVALGRKHGIPTPVNATVFAALKPYANGAPA